MMRSSPLAKSLPAMLILNDLTDHRAPLDQADAEMLSIAAAREVERFLACRVGHKPTPLLSLPNLARVLAACRIQVWIFVCADDGVPRLVDWRSGCP